MGRTWHFPLVLVLVVVGCGAAPVSEDLDAVLDDFLEKLYDRVHNTAENSAGDDGMQGDQPVSDNSINADLSQILNLSNANVNMTDYFRTSRNRAKDNWIQVLKENILQQIGRSNMTVLRNDDNQGGPMNMSPLLPHLFNGTVLDGDHIAEKIRSYYPSCEVPSNMDQDIWKDDNILNLYFKSFDQVSDERNFNIATATLRLYRIPTENLTRNSAKAADCDGNNSTEEDRLLRISIYWYTKSLRKKKVKRRLSDSKVIQENARWVELSVKPATRAWSRGKNLGLAVLVEDQEGNTLRADRLFKGTLCMVGASTPKPIPTIIIDAARQSNQLDQRIYSLFGRNSTPPLSGDISMLPTIDICTLEFPENFSLSASHISHFRINACNLKKSHEHAQLLAERDRLERLTTLPELLSPRHIRHQRQHHKNEYDPRSKIINKRILTNEELQQLNLNFTIDR